ncbi:hypothetical protein PTI98_012298 [Pleurotus ostreatus]|nr:hypothetical protein PTI98_012298 [Pleurotus ostreatus]
MLSADQLKRQLERISGVYAIKHDMCTNGCIAYTGLYKLLEECPQCLHPRRNHYHDPFKTFTTYPIGPQIQAQWASEEGANDMRYRQRRTDELLERLRQNGGKLDVYDDFLCGSDYLEAVINGDITNDDTLLIFSMDSAQLYRMKQSDCWLYIWVILNLDPNKRYKVRYVLPAGSIPGPDSPKNIDSFVFPSLYHLAAIQNEGGLRIWDGGQRRLSSSRLRLVFVTADSVALAKLARWVGHLGRFPCRIFCGLPGRHKPGAPHYFIALLRPNGRLPANSHGDVSIAALPNGSAARFLDNLRSVITSPNPTQFERRRRDSGLSGVSIFFGIELVFPPPFCFTGDMMHLDGLNLPDLLIGLFRGESDLVSTSDSVMNWEWAVLHDKDTWVQHGELVADARPYLPNCIERPPRNPEKKISSGFKASEYLVYVYALCPALLHGVLPHAFWKHFCKLVRALHLLSQRSISSEAVSTADKLLIDYCQDFELLYYQRRMDRLHFIRPSIHFLLHRGPETHRLGPNALLAQWVLERTIGNLGAEIRQHQNPYANLAQRSLLRCQLNAFRALVPGFVESETGPSHLGQDIGDGYTLLHKTEDTSHLLHPDSHEASALRTYLDHIQPDHDNIQELRVIRWARLRLPNGHTARSLWVEQFTSKIPRRSRNVKLITNSIVQIAEVMYYFKFHVNGLTLSLAMVTLYGTPDPTILEDSSNLLWVCDFPAAGTAICVVDAKSVESVIGMVPYKWKPVIDLAEGHLMKPGKYFMVEQLSHNVAIVDTSEDDDNEE